MSLLATFAGLSLVELILTDGLFFISSADATEFCIVPLGLSYDWYSSYGKPGDKPSSVSCILLVPSLFFPAESLALRPENSLTSIGTTS